MTNVLLRELGFCRELSFYVYVGRIWLVFKENSARLLLK
jgi:hypothetical protein